jgi:hypothetical protein
MTDGKRTLTVSEISVQLSLEFSDMPNDGVSNALKKAAARMDALDGLFKEQPRFYVGVVVAADFPMLDRDAATKAAFAEIFKSDNVNLLQSFSATQSFNCRDFTASLETNLFKLFDVIVEGSQGIHIDPDFASASEEGIQYKLDINTRPLIDQPRAQMFSELVVELPSILTDIAPSAIGSEVTQLIRERGKL